MKSDVGELHHRLQRLIDVPPSVFDTLYQPVHNSTIYMCVYMQSKLLDEQQDRLELARVARLRPGQETSGRPDQADLART